MGDSVHLAMDRGIDVARRRLFDDIQHLLNATLVTYSQYQVHEYL